MPLIILFLVIPLIEIAVFVAVDDKIGLLNTLLLCIVTAIAGGLLLKYQGRATIMAIKSTMEKGTIPIGELFDGACLVAAGALLMTPGFVTDIIGFSLFLPPFRLLLRKFITKYGQKHFKATSCQSSSHYYKKEHDEIEVIEADYEIIDKDNRKN